LRSHEALAGAFGAGGWLLEAPVMGVAGGGVVVRDKKVPRCKAARDAARDVVFFKRETRGSAALEVCRW
jgi:hypothetical protein